MRHLQSKEDLRPKQSPRTRQNDLLEAINTWGEADNTDAVWLAHREMDRLGDDK